MMWHASPIINGCLLGMLLFGAAAEGAVNARYLRVEAPLSGRLALQKIEIHSGEQDLARQNKQLGFASSENDWLPIGDHKHARNCIQGKIEADGRGARVQAKKTVGAWMEFDLHREAPINRVVVARGISDSYGDRFYRIVSLLDAERRVVFTKAFDIRDPAHRELIHTFDTSEPGGELIGTVVPPAADGWMSVGRLIKIEPAKQAADATARRAAFEQRNRPAAIEGLAHEFFGVMDLEKPELEPIARLYRAGRFQQSLDAYRDHFLNNKIDGIHNVWGMTFGSPRYAGQADDLLEGRVITVGVREVHGIKYTPATTDWGALPQPDSPEFDAALAISRSWAQVNHLQGALLDAYAETGETRYLDRWAVMTDDWSMHFFDDIERSPHNIRDFFVKDTLQSFVGFCVVLHDVAQRRPEFVEQAPSATLARLLLPILEEYPPPYWRLARKTVFNHTINGHLAALQVSPILDDFFAGQRLARETRQHAERIWTLMMTRDGTMIEIGDEGHMGMPLRLAWIYLEMLRDPTPPAWFTPDYRARFETGYRNILTYIVRHRTPSGHRHRMTMDPQLDELLTDLPDAARYVLTDPNDPRAETVGYSGVPRGEIYQPLNIHNDATVRRIIETLVGRGRDRAKLPPSVQSAHDMAVKRFGDRPYDGPPEFTSDWMPYGGLYYLRRNWEPEASFLHMLCQAGGGSANGQLWNTEYRYWDYGFPLVRVEPLAIDRLPQYPMAGRLGNHPGSKTERLVEAPQTPAPYRWLSTARYDVAESSFEGTYQKISSSANRKKLVESSELVENVRTLRQIIQIRSHRLFVVTNRVTTDDDALHHYAMPSTFYLTQQGKQPFAETQLAPDDAQATIRLANPGSPGLVVRHFGPQEIKYRPDQRQVGKKPQSLRGDPFPGFLLTERTVEIGWKAAGDNVLLTLLEPRTADGSPRLSDVTRIGDGASTVGFRATGADGETIEYLTAIRPPATLRLGKLAAEAEALLCVSGPRGTSGVVLGARREESADFEFELRDGAMHVVERALRPIDPVRFEPGTNVFIDQVDVSLVSDTPGVEIRYTLDGSEPTPHSIRYTEPLRLTETAFIRARAYRPGVKENPFEITGTRATVASSAHFEKQPLMPAIDAAPPLATGLKYDYLEGTWFKLYSYADRMSAASSGNTRRLLDVSMRKTDGPFGVRYSGYIDIPHNGVYTFHGPDEFVRNVAEPGYDLRLWIGGKEWDLGQRWHGLGQWSVGLEKGLHEFQLTFADARATDIENQRRDLWREYPQPWAVWRGTTPVVEISGPGIEKQQLPNGWLHAPQD